MCDSGDMGGYDSSVDTSSESSIDAGESVNISDSSFSSSMESSNISSSGESMDISSSSLEMNESTEISSDSVESGEETEVSPSASIDSGENCEIGSSEEGSLVESVENDENIEDTDADDNESVETNIGERYENADVKDNRAENHNSHPYEDINDSFEYADENYDVQSNEWQENANRQLETINDQKSEITISFETLNDEYNSINDRLCNEELSADEATELTDRANEILVSRAMEMNKYSELNKRETYIKQNIDVDRMSFFAGRDNSDFVSAYDDMNTDPQGNADRNFGGDCGIIESVNLTNQQLGENLSEKQGIDIFTKDFDHPICEVNEDYGDNGGTTIANRRDYFESRNMNYDVEFGSADTGKRINLADMAERFNNGESIGIGVKAQDLSQLELSERDFNTFDLERYKELNYSNHATTVAGFSYYSDGRVAGVWINDTGGWTGSNRVYLSESRFNQMQDNTVGFWIEYVNKGDANSYVKKR